MANTLVRGDLEPLLLGGCFFGSGGGGTIESARGLVKHFERVRITLRTRFGWCPRRRPPKVMR